MKHIGRRDDYITATFTRNYASSNDAYDDDGKLKAVTQTETTTITFFGKITDMKSDTNVGGGKRRNRRKLMIECDSRDVANLTVDYTLTYDGSSDVFQVSDIYDSEFRFTTEVIAEHIR